jgi:hypothetical protein
MKTIWKKCDFAFENPESIIELNLTPEEKWYVEISLFIHKEKELQNINT